jgi:hypothetical protein
MDHLLYAGEGAAGVGLLYFLYLVATKGLPAALAWVKSTWNGAANAVKADIAAAKSDIEALKGDVAAAKTDIAALKQKVGA